MTKGSFPKVAKKVIDLADYGGEGTITIKALTTGAQGRIVEKVMSIAKKENGGKALSPEEIQDQYAITIAMMSVQESIIEGPGIDAQNPRLDIETISDFPEDLTKDIVEAIGELASFPLGQTDGEESKQEQSTPTNALY